MFVFSISSSLYKDYDGSHVDEFWNFNKTMLRMDILNKAQSYFSKQLAMCIKNEKEKTKCVVCLLL